MPPADLGHVAEVQQDQSLGRARRLRHPAEFAAIKAKGARVVRRTLIVNALRCGRETSRLGVVTSRKVGRAVDRSRARRLLREIFRRHREEFISTTDVVLVAMPPIRGRSYADVERDFLAAARGAHLMKPRRP